MRGRDEYNLFAGHKIQRTEALTDGVFAIAMTLLVLELSIPFSTAVTTEADLGRLLFAIAPKLLVYFMSFITLGIFWTGQSFQYTYISTSDRHLNWISIFYLMFVSLVPFTTALLGQYITFKLAVGIYWLNILLLGVILFVHWQYASKNGLVAHESADIERVDRAVRQRIIVAQSLYAGAALMCFISTYLSIGIFIAIQLNYALSPRFRSVRARE
jgi:uncharacterized membrane protein